MKNRKPSDIIFWIVVILAALALLYVGYSFGHLFAPAVKFRNVKYGELKK